MSRDYIKILEEPLSHFAFEAFWSWCQCWWRERERERESFFVTLSLPFLGFVGANPALAENLLLVVVVWLLLPLLSLWLVPWGNAKKWCDASADAISARPAEQRQLFSCSS